MTIASTITLQQYACNGATTQFGFGNKVFSAADLVVTLIDTQGNQYAFTNQANSALGLSYSVQNVDVDSGCLVVFNAAPTNGWTLDIRTVVPNTQSTSIKNQGPYLPELHEEAFDRLTREIQDLLRKTYTYGIHGQDLEATPWPAMPLISARKGSALMFDGSTGLPTIGIPSTITYTPGTLGILLYPTLGTEVGVVNNVYPYYDLRRWGAKFDGSTLDDTAWANAIQSAVNAVVAGSAGVRLTGPAGTSQISAQLVFPNGVSFKGAGRSSTIIRVASTFSALSTPITTGAAGQGGAIRVGTGVTSTFGVMLEDFVLELGLVTGVASIGIGSSDVQDCGLRNIVVNNFVSRGVQFIGAGGSFASVNGFEFDNVQCFKAAAGAGGGYPFDIQNGTYPWSIRDGQTVAPVGNPMSGGFNLANTVGALYSCNVDGAGSVVATDGVLITNANITIDRLVVNAATNAVHITGTGSTVVIGLTPNGGTNAILDAGGGGAIAKTIAAGIVPLYVRGPLTPSIIEQLNVYGNVLIAAGGGVGLTIDKAGSIGTGRLKLFVGDGTAGTTADEDYVSILNTVLHFWAGAAGTTEVARVNANGLNNFNAAALITSLIALNNGAGAGAGTLTNAPAAGNPTKWVPINDNGTTRYVPAW